MPKENLAIGVICFSLVDFYRHIKQHGKITHNQGRVLIDNVSYIAINETRLCDGRMFSEVQFTERAKLNPYYNLLKQVAEMRIKK